MTAVITYRGSVFPWQCDQMGHMNVMWYVSKFDEATWQLLAAIGLTPSRVRDERIGMAGVEQHIEYRRELFPGDVVTISSTILEVKEKALRFVHEMQKNDTGDPVARMVLVAVHIDLLERKALALPADVRSNALAMTDAERQ